MNKTAATNWKQCPTIAYYSGFGGIEIKNIFSYGIIVYVAGAWCSNKSVHRVKVYYNNSGDAYFKHKGTRIKLSECIRV